MLASRRSLRTDGLNRFALTKVIFQPGYFALECVDAFADATVVHY
jgi:hypothetical protein